MLSTFGNTDKFFPILKTGELEAYGKTNYDLLTTTYMGYNNRNLHADIICNNRGTLWWEKK
jgi:hypothetical protein